MTKRSQLQKQTNKINTENNLHDNLAAKKREKKSSKNYLALQMGKEENKQKISLRASISQLGIRDIFYL